MPTLEQLTGYPRGIVLWADGSGLVPTKWRGWVAPADLLSTAQRITERDLLPPARQRLRQEAKGARVAALWRTGPKIIAPLAEND